MNKVDTLVFWESHAKTSQRRALMSALQRERELNEEGCRQCRARMKRWPLDRSCTGVATRGVVATPTIQVVAQFPQERHEPCLLQGKIRTR